MKLKKSLLYGTASALAMMVLILDTNTAIIGAQEAVELCIRTVLPSLFPFIFLSILLTEHISGVDIPILRPLGRLLRIPAGSESLLLMGLLGGYPVGAQCVARAYQTGRLSRQTAQRMLGFCSNAGNSFIFGMVGALFSAPAAAWSLWVIHILSALVTGMLLPGSPEEVSTSMTQGTAGISDAMQRTLRVMGSICGWVILFRVIICFCQRWFLWLLPAPAQMLFIGLLELTNGCCAIAGLPEDTAFLLCTVLLSFGGICVGMQTVSVTGQLGTGMYFPGKVMQCCISLLLAIPVQRLLFNCGNTSPVLLSAPLAAVLAVLFCLRRRKNNSSNLAPMGV